MDSSTLHQSRLVLFVLDGANGRPLRWISLHDDVIGVELAATAWSVGSTPTVTELLRESPAFAAAVRRAVNDAMDMCQGTGVINRT